MKTINEVKQLAETDTPLLFFQCTLPSGEVEYWSTHSLSLNGAAYSARVLKHNLFELQLSADDAMEGVSQLSLTLANADSTLSQINREVGFKGSQLTVYFAFADLPTQSITTESTVLFKGIAGDPDSISEDSLRLTFTNKLTLQRIPVPDVRIQRACPWSFPRNDEQRLEAKDGGTLGSYSRYYRCGYSADIAGGVGNLNSGVPYSSCDGTRTQCQARGMFTSDLSGNVTKRFGGFEFVPSTIMVRTFGDKTSHLSPVLDNSAKYNDPVPLVYGTGWIKTPVVFSRNDGNLTHVESLIGMGPITGPLKVVVNDVEIPKAVSGQDMTATGWYSLVTTGDRTGSFNPDFTDSKGNPLGDPYGSLSVLSVVVPNAISTGKALPTVEVLVQGLKLNLYSADGALITTEYSDNPAWVILDVLRRSGWGLSELNLASFVSAGEFCQTLISTTDINGNPLQTTRYKCNLVLVKRFTAANVIRGIRVASCLMLRYGVDGLLELLPETSLAAQQASLPEGSNSTAPLNGGWPVYEFSDGTASFSGIARDAKGGSSVQLSSRSISETSNRLSVEFQDEFNEYQQDSFSVVDSDDSALIGYEISSQSTALGISNQSQATRVVLRQLDKSTKGNLYVQFATSFRALKVRPGDLIALTYAKEGLSRTPFRVLKLSPSLNYQMVGVLAQIHDDDWYSDNPAILAGAGRQPGSQSQAPRALIGTVPHYDSEGHLEYFDYSIQEQVQAQVDGTATDIISVAYVDPTAPATTSSHVPLLSLSPQYSSIGGSLDGGTIFYYAVTSVDDVGQEGPLSFTVPAEIPEGTGTNSVIVTGLSFPSGTMSFNVYRGTSPQMLYRIASALPIASSFTDTGYGCQPITPPDSSFDHANFYYRYEYAGPFTATRASETSITNSDLGATPLAYSGMSVRIIEGLGQGQERIISSNDQTTLSLKSNWTVVPDQSSSFVISEPSWRFAAVSKKAPVQFEILYKPGVVIQVTGHGANVSDLEGSVDLCPITRRALGGGAAETGTTIAPDYVLSAPGAGMMSLSQIGFDTLKNTSSVSTGTLQMFLWNELSSPSAFSLVSPIDGASSTIQVNKAQAYIGQIVQVGQELMSVVSVDASGNSYGVVRSVLGSTAGSHAPGDYVLHLDQTTTIVPFSLGFFQNRASTNFLHTFAVPDVRVSASELFVTNAFGDSQARSQCYTSGTAGGLRTLSGGQFSLQVAGLLGTQTSAAPALLVEASHAIRDVHASVSQAPTGANLNIDVVQSGTVLCSMTIAAGTTEASVIDGVALPCLEQNSTLTLNTTLNILPADQSTFSSGKDLTVTIRL